MMGYINTAAYAWSQWMGNMFWQVGLLVILVMFIDMAIRRRAWPHVRYVFWGMVFLKLLIPPTWHMPTGIVSSIQPTVSEHIAVQIENNVLFDRVAPISGTTELEQIQDSESVKAERLTWQSTLFLIWITGMLFFALMLVIQLSRLPKRSQRRYGRDAPEWFSAVLDSASRCLRLKKIPFVVFSRAAKSPAVYGLFRPALVLPGGYFEDLTREQAEHVLLHELCHIKRGDLWVHWFCIAVQIVYWFNPLLILARRQMRHVSEICCDLSVAYVLREKTAAYRETLLSTSRKLLADTAEPGIGLLGIFEEPFRIVARLKWLEQKTWEHRKRKIAATMVAILVMVGFVMPMAGHSQSEEKNKEIPLQSPLDDQSLPILVDESDSQKRFLDNLYGTLLGDLDLPSEKLESFKKLLIDELWARNDIFKERPQVLDPPQNLENGSLAQWVQNQNNEWEQRATDVVTELDRKIAELIGDERYSEFVTYREHLMEINLVNSITAYNAIKGMRITGEQQEKLVSAMYQARIKILGKKDVSIRDKVWGNFPQSNCKLLDAYLDSAEPILSKSQLENFQNFLSQLKQNSLNPSLLDAVNQGDVETVKSLLSCGADVNSKRTKDDATPLWIACSRGHVEIAKLLLDNGAMVNAKDNTGHTPLFVPSQEGYVEIVKLLLDKGAEVNVKATGSIVNNTPLKTAKFSNNTEIVRLLENAGATN